MINHKNTVTSLSGLVALAGLWLLASPFVIPPPATSAALQSNVISGVIVTVFAAIHAWRSPSKSWLAWVSGLIGLWALASPWLLGFAHSGAFMWSNVIAGLVIVVLAVWSAIASESYFSGLTA